jgi:hypothetical protein
MESQAPPSKRSRFWRYLFYVLATFGVFLLIVFIAGAFWIGKWLLPRKTPAISAKVVDAVTGKPLPGMDVCLIVTYINNGPTDGSGHYLMVKRSEKTKTDASGAFSFPAAKDQIDFPDTWDGFGIAITDPAAQWYDLCGRDANMLGGSVLSYTPSVFQRELYFQRDDPNSKHNLNPPYFPVVLVRDPSNPHPKPYGYQAFWGPLPDEVLVRKLDDPQKITVSLIPLLRDTAECQSAHDPNAAELCRDANDSTTGDALRKAYNLAPTDPY